MAILAFALVAGFTATSSTVCDSNTNPQTSTKFQVQTKYPFFTYDNSTIVNGVNGQIMNTTTGTSFSQHIISGQFFVAWGVLTMLYCITAMVVYILFTANENLERVVDILIYVVCLKYTLYHIAGDFGEH